MCFFLDFLTNDTANEHFRCLTHTSKIVDQFLRSMGFETHGRKKLLGENMERSVSQRKSMRNFWCVITWSCSAVVIAINIKCRNYSVYNHFPITVNFQRVICIPCGGPR